MFFHGKHLEYNHQQGLTLLTGVQPHFLLSHGMVKGGQKVITDHVTGGNVKLPYKKTLKKYISTCNKYTLYQSYIY